MADVTVKVPRFPHRRQVHSVCVSPGRNAQEMVPMVTVYARATNPGAREGARGAIGVMERSTTERRAHLRPIWELRGARRVSRRVKSFYRYHFSMECEQIYIGYSRRVQDA